MSENSDPGLEKRLAALEKGNPRHGASPKRRAPLLAILTIGLILGGGALIYLFSGPGEESALPTATPDEFQSEGDGFGEIKPFVPPSAPEPEIVLVTPDPVEPNGELLAQTRGTASADRRIEERARTGRRGRQRRGGID